MGLSLKAGGYVYMINSLRKRHGRSILGGHPSFNVQKHQWTPAETYCEQLPCFAKMGSFEGSGEAEVLEVVVGGE